MSASSISWRGIASATAVDMFLSVDPTGTGPRSPAAGRRDLRPWESDAHGQRIATPRRVPMTTDTTNKVDGHYGLIMPALEEA
jgi:hypothetical protein